jgi:putative tRNA adenosine deaminase-associated protein
MSEDAGGDSAVVAWREDGRWSVASLPPHVLDDLDTLISALRQQPGEGGTLGLVSVGDDFFVLLRVIGHGDDVRILLSDATAAEEWPLARAVLEALDVSPSDVGDDADYVTPAGDLAIFADLGLDAMELGALCDDMELYPDEVLESVAGRLGFGEPYAAAVDSVRH